MKKIILSVIFILFLIGQVSVSLGIDQIKTIRVGQELRMILIFSDLGGTHFQYFTEPGAGKTPKILGEEIFKNGEKVFDSYSEND